MNVQSKDTNFAKSNFSALSFQWSHERRYKNLLILLLLICFILPFFTRKQNFPFIHYQMYSSLDLAPFPGFEIYVRRVNEDKFEKVQLGDLFLVPYFYDRTFRMVLFPKRYKHESELGPSNEVLRQHLLYYNKVLRYWPQRGCAACAAAPEYVAAKVDRVLLRPAISPDRLLEESERKTLLWVDLNAE